MNIRVIVQFILQFKIQKCQKYMYTTETEMMVKSIQLILKRVDSEPARGAWHQRVTDREKV